MVSTTVAYIGDYSIIGPTKSISLTCIRYNNVGIVIVASS